VSRSDRRDRQGWDGADAPGGASSRPEPGAGSAGRGAAQRRRLDRLTPAHVQRLVLETRNGQTSRGSAPSTATLQHVHKLIRNALADAYRMELVTRNVATQVKTPPMNNQRRPDLGLAEAKRLLQVIDGERLEAPYVLALTTGLRRGELLGLRWDDIDLSSRQLHVRRALQRVDGKLQMVEPKTSTSVRAVVPPRIAVRTSRNIEDGRMRNVLRWGMAGGNTGSCSLRLSGHRSSRAT
jgi:integrase